MPNSRPARTGQNPAVDPKACGLMKLGRFPIDAIEFGSIGCFPCTLQGLVDGSRPNGPTSCELVHSAGRRSSSFLMAWGGPPKPGGGGCLPECLHERAVSIVRRSTLSFMTMGSCTFIASCAGRLLVARLVGPARVSSPAHRSYHMHLWGFGQGGVAGHPSHLALTRTMHNAAFQTNGQCVSSGRPLAR